MEWWQYLLNVVLLFMGWSMAYLLDPWLGQKFALRKEVLATYLIPYRKWCANL